MIERCQKCNSSDIEIVDTMPDMEVQDGSYIETWQCQVCNAVFGRKYAIVDEWWCDEV